MKKGLLLLSFIICAFLGFAQQRPAGLPSPNSTGYGKIGYQQADSGFIQQPRDTFPAKYPTVIRWSGDNKLWESLGNGASWHPLSSGSLRSIYAGYGLTKINDSTLGVDTGLIATRARVQKAVDSLGVVKQPYNANTTILGNTTTGSGGTIVLSGSPALTLPSISAIQVSGGIASLPTGSGTLAYTSALTPYKLVSDTGFNGGYTTRNTTKKIADSLAALISGGGFGTVQSVSTTDGVGIVSSVASPTANPNITIRVDTNTIATRLRVQKGIDSLGVLITTGDAAKLNISDTAAMLTPNYRRTITKITNSDLVNSTISGTSLGSNLPALSFGTYLQNSATSYNGTTANTISTNATSSNIGSTLVARDVNGDFSARNISAALVGNASSASTINITNDNSTNATMYPIWSAATSGTNSPKVSSTKITFNPSTGVLTSNFAGALTGNASSASVLQTPRTINGVAFDGSANISISASVDSSLSAGYGITGSPFNGSLGRTWVVDTTKIVPYTDTLASYGVATKSFVRSFGYGTGSVTSVATNNGSGITGGTITTTGTIAADTVILATRPRVQKGIDSLGNVITSGLSLKVNISDTASMLTNYRTGIIALNADTATLAARFTNQTNLANSKVAISDTATMLSGYKTYYPRAALSAGTGISYNASTGVITNSSPSSGGTVTSVATNTGSGITGGTITGSGTIAADTSVLSTKANVTALLLGKLGLTGGSTITTVGTLSSGSIPYSLLTGTPSIPTVSGTTNYIPKFTGSSTIGNSVLFDNGTNIGLGNTSPIFKLDVSGSGRFTSSLEVGSLGTGVQQIFVQGTGYDMYLGTSGGSIFGYPSQGISTVFNTQSVPLGVGTNAAQPLILGTNATARVEITSVGVVNTTSRLNVNGAADNSLFSLNNGGGTTYTNGFSPNASNYTGSITLGGGTTYVYTGSGAVTWTLPNPSGNNQIYIIKNNGSGAITLNAYSSNQLIPLSSTTGVSSISIGIGETVTIQQDGSAKSYVMNVGTSTSGVSSGSYTPTVANVSNTSSLNASPAYYSSVGNVVTVGWAVNGNCTASTTGSFTFSIPTGSNFTTTSQGWGSAVSQVGSVITPAVSAASNGTTNIIVQWEQPAGLSTFSFVGTVVYQKQ